MSHQGPLVVVSSGGPGPLANLLPGLKVFPVVEVAWPEVCAAVEEIQPIAVVAATPDPNESHLMKLAHQLSESRPYTPLIVIDSGTTLPANALPFSSANGHPDGLGQRLNAALRVRTLHATVLRRTRGENATRVRTPETDPIQDASVLLIGRGSTYPALSVALGEQVGVVGALSIEAAAKHLNVRELNGIVIGDGFSARVVDAFLTVLADDARFRNLPVVVTASDVAGSYELPNLEFITGAPPLIAANFLPLVRQNAFEIRLGRTLKSIEAGGLLDPRTGLLMPAAFHRDLTTAVEETQARGGGLCVARLSFDQTQDRVRFDAARLVSRLMRRMDFGALEDDGSIIVAFPDTDLRNAHMITRRLASVIKHTVHGPRRASRVDPHTAVVTLLPTDSTTALLSRLNDEAQRAAS